jgi:hypothetical protein
MTIRGKPNVDAFLKGDDESIKATVVKQSRVKPTLVEADADAETAKRTKKLFELPEPMIADLEQRCIDERRQLGRRVTQTEIVERALRIYLYSNV